MKKVIINKKKKFYTVNYILYIIHDLYNSSC